MEPAAAGALYAAENLFQGAAALIKGITHPTLPIKAELTHITSVPLPRSHHTVSVVKGRAYIFGGESEPGKLADNAMHAVILPSSGVLEADYTSFPARAANGLDDVPSSRRGHTATVIGDSIYVFGGEGDNVANEKGRVWVYHTVRNTWTYLDPASDAVQLSQRSGHAAASSDLPGSKTAVTFIEKAPQAPVDPAKAVPEPADPDTWGTLFVVGGRDTTSNELYKDALAFDIRTRSWSSIPTPPGQSREGASLALVGDFLYLFGGKQLETINTSRTEVLDASHVWKHAEGGTTPLTSGWDWEEVTHVEAPGKAAVLPSGRANAGLVGVTTGQGRRYLLALGGEGEGLMLLDDIWALQLSSERSTAAKLKDTMRADIRRDTHESEWAEVLYKHVDSTGEEEKAASIGPGKGLGQRGHFGVAKGTEVDGSTAIVWGGVNAQGQILTDGWMITVDR